MKIYISADIEGVAGITNWEEARKEHAAYPEFREAMTAEVVAACEGAIAAGARDRHQGCTWQRPQHHRRKASGVRAAYSRLERPSSLHGSGAG
jgi:hypothetical protein